MDKMKNPLSVEIYIDFEALNWLTDNEIYDNVFIYDDENIHDEPNVSSANDSYGNMVSTIPMPPAQEWERGAVQYWINELYKDIPMESTPPSQLSKNSSKLSKINASLVNQQVIQILDANPPYIGHMLVCNH